MGEGGGWKVNKVFKIVCGNFCLHLQDRTPSSFVKRLAALAFEMLANFNIALSLRASQNNTVRNLVVTHI